MNTRTLHLGGAVVALLASAGVVAVAQGSSAPQILSDKTFAYWQRFIQPSTAEAAWERPGWQTSLWAGLRLAQEKQQPLLAWFMTGHPCGMT